MNIDEYFKELVKIPSPSLKEEGVSSYIKEKMASFGYSIREDSVHNLVCYKESNSEKIALSAHMDTVPPALYPKLEENSDKYYTDGTTALGADDKCALAVILEAAEHYKRDNLVAIFTVGEEIGLYGSSHLDSSLFSGLLIKECYVLDAEKEVGIIINSAVGKSKVTVKVKGKSAHAGFNIESGINAIRVASELISCFPAERPNEYTTLNIGSFKAEGSINIVPENAEFQFEIRSLDDSVRYSLIKEIEANCKRIASEERAEITLVHDDLYSFYSVSEDSEIVKKAKDAIKRIGRGPVVTATKGGSDANNFNKLGLPSVVLASGYYNAHSKSEYLDKKEFKALSELVYAILDS